MQCCLLCCPMSKVADSILLLYASRPGCCGQSEDAQSLLQRLAASVLHF